MIRFENVHIGYGEDLISNIHMSLPETGIIGLFGKNGSGKSTLFKTLIGLQPIRKGEIFIDQQNIHAISNQARAKKLAYCQTQLNTYGNMSILDVVSNGRIPYQSWLGGFNSNDKTAINEALQHMKIESIQNQMVSESSDGQKQKALIASALAQETKVILLDEPTAFLDYPSKTELIHLLTQIAKSGKLIIVSTHDLEIFEPHCDLKLLIHDKVLVNSESDQFEEAWTRFVN